ncbi:MAG TPA: hypothetical protein VMR74_12210 [Gammaproteobacteria bacterium]|nr:hypothetical protein [Gammaproteobacteria bacterium]
MKPFTYLVPLALLAATAQAQDATESAEPRMPAGIGGLDEGQARAPSADWLLDAVDDEERFRRIQIYAGGTYEQMWQIGYRYEQVYDAILNENLELALHHWGKLRSVFNVALMKRPNRTPNAELMFLNESWGRLDDALRQNDIDDSRQIFLQERVICMACHVAEGMPF